MQAVGGTYRDPTLGADRKASAQVPVLHRGTAEDAEAFWEAVEGTGMEGT